MNSLTFLLTRVGTFRQIPVKLTPRPDASSRVKLKVTIRKALLSLKLVTNLRLLGAHTGTPAREVFPPPP